MDALLALFGTLSIIKAAPWVIAIAVAILIVWMLIVIAKRLREISIKLGKLNAILANRQTTGNNDRSSRDTGAGDRQPSEPATAPEQNQ